MKKTLTCIECPIGCSLTADIENCRVIHVSGNKCPKGSDYAVAEIENPVRTLTSTVAAEGLAMSMVPVRTNKPIPKAKLIEAMAEVKKARVKAPVTVGQVIISDLCGLGGVDLVATRNCA